MRIRNPVFFSFFFNAKVDEIIIMKSTYCACDWIYDFLPPIIIPIPKSAKVLFTPRLVKFSIIILKICALLPRYFEFKMTKSIFIHTDDNIINYFNNQLVYLSIFVYLKYVLRIRGGSSWKNWKLGSMLKGTYSKKHQL